MIYKQAKTPFFDKCFFYFFLVINYGVCKIVIIFFSLIVAMLPTVRMKCTNNNATAA